MPNRENVEKLIAWLEAGAPHLDFNMDYGLVELPSNHHAYQGCGTVCCIAGAAYAMSWAEAWNRPMHEAPLAEWCQIEPVALGWLDLPQNHGDFGHMLFSPEYADAQGIHPADTKAAAAACRRALENPDKNPWRAA